MATSGRLTQWIEMPKLWYSFDDVHLAHQILRLGRAPDSVGLAAGGRCSRVLVDRCWLSWLGALFFFLSGCVPARLHQSTKPHPIDRSAAIADIVKQDLTQIESCAVCREPHPLVGQTATPRESDPAPQDFWPLSLQEVHDIAAKNSKVLRDLGGQVVSSPAAVPTQFDIGIQKSDPQFGPQAALAAFDHSYSTQLFFDRTDRAFNNAIAGGGAFELQQDLMTAQAGVSKRSLNGTEWTLQANTLYDDNNRNGNVFPNTWESIAQGGVRKPLLRGAGTAFNAIAGPGATPGLNFSNGIVLARLNTSISLFDFTLAMRNYLRQVEDMYWKLYVAYHDLEARKQARDAAQRTWQMVRARHAEGLEQGEADKEAQAHYQFLVYQELYTETLNGSDQVTGVYESERALRRLLGLPATDTRLIFPVESPTTAPVAYEWQPLLIYSLDHREEIRRQVIRVRQQQLRVIAARNFLLPRLDLIGEYRVRGLGDDLTGSGPRFASATQDFTSFDHQEWRAGVEMDMPSGFRQGRAAVQHARLQLVREQTVLQEQELQISHELSNAVARVSQLQSMMRVNHNRVEAAKQRLEATEVQFTAGKSTVDLLLESQEQFFEALRQNYMLLATYSFALTQVHFSAGSYLEFVGVVVAEGSESADVSLARTSIDRR